MLTEEFSTGDNGDFYSALDTYNDVDFCLNLRERGLLIVYTPYAMLYHHESVSRGYENTKSKKRRLKAEGAFLKRKWKSYINNDPYYNPNLSRIRLDLSLRMEPAWYEQVSDLLHAYRR